MLSKIATLAAGAAAMHPSDPPQQFYDAMFLQTPSPAQKQELSSFGEVPCQYIY